MAIVQAVDELRAIADEKTFFILAPRGVAADLMPLGIHWPFALRTQVQQPVVVQMRGNWLVELV
ncbi:hypothetical protein D9M70_633750 [compost metagenome]